MKRLAVSQLSQVILPAAWLVWGAGFLPGALSGSNTGNASLFQMAAVAGLLLAVAAWFGRGSLLLAENAGWQPGLLVLLVLAAVLGMALGSVQQAMLVTALAGLAWWDLADFARRLELFGRAGSPEMDLLVSAHLRRLALALGLGLASGLIALSITVRLSLGGAMALGALAVLLIRVGVGRIQGG